MPKLKVTTPFSLRPGTGQPLREFSVGVHDISDDDLQHWFVQGCIAEGRAVVMGADYGTGQDATVTVSATPARPVKAQEYTEAALKKLNNTQLAEMAQGLGITLNDPQPVKAAMVSAILKAKETLDAQKSEPESAGGASEDSVPEGEV